MTLAHSYVETASSNYPIFYFLLVILLTFFSIDSLKIVGAKYLRPLVTNRLLNGLNILIGIVFSVFGIFLIIRSYIEQVQ
jgi:threonine/homoserine/homoserine lactone efflux protein